MINEKAMYGAFIFAVALGAVAFAGMVYNFQNSGVDAHTHPAGSLVHTPPYDDAWIQTEFENMADYHQSVSETLIELRTDVAILKSRGSVTTQADIPPNTVTADFRLVTADNKLQQKSQFSRDVEAILVTGDTLEGKKTEYKITIRAPSGTNFVRDVIETSWSDGEFSSAWVVPDKAEVGKYTAEITVKGKRDSIEFSLI